MKIENSFFDLGIVKKSDTIKLETKVYNIGKDSLYIINYGTGCGCTVANIGKKRLAPGDSTTFDIKYSPLEDTGRINKSVVLETNSESPYTVITLTGNIQIDKIN